MGVKWKLWGRGFPPPYCPALTDPASGANGAIIEPKARLKPGLREHRPPRRAAMGGPLEGIRVLDFTIAQQGAYATLLMADMGAEVIKVEEPGRGEIGRGLGMARKRGVSAYFLAINRGKKSLTLDLKSERGHGIALRLARDCDVVAHNFRPGVMEKLGLGYEAFKQVNRRIIYAGASAFGTKGRLGWKPGNDILAQAMSGLMSTTGEEGGGAAPAGGAAGGHPRA